MNKSTQIETFSHDNINDATILLFYRARLIIASHGAGLSHLIFLRPGTLVIGAMCQLPYGSPCYRNMAYKLGLRYYGQLTTNGRGTKCRNGMVINFDEIKKIVKYGLEHWEDKL